MIFAAIILTLFFVWLIGRRSSAPAANGLSIYAPKPLVTPAMITVGVYNIHRARGTDGEKDITRIADIIKHTDIIGLCEIQGWTGIKGKNQISQLASRLSLAGLFCPTQKRWLHYDRGNGILSRLTIEKWQRTPLKDTIGRHTRCLCRADILIDQTPVSVFVTHIARRIDQQSQLKAVFDTFNQHEHAILMGDFNVDSDFALLQKLIQKSGAIDALNSIDNSKRIDWIVVKGFKVKKARMQDSSASDHPYYQCQLQLSNEPESRD